MRKKILGVPFGAFIAVVCFCIAGIVIGSFYDFDINVALANKTQIGSFFATYGSYFSYCLYPAAGMCLYKGLRKKGRQYDLLAVLLLTIAYFLAVYYSNSYNGSKVREMMGYTAGSSSALLSVCSWLFWAVLYLWVPFVCYRVLDDKDAGNLFHMQFWKIPTYYDKWIDDLNIKLTKEEGSFLKGQMISSYPSSMLAFILRNGLTEIFECKSFQEMASLVKTFPEQIQQDYALAYDFSSFLFVLRTVYNIVVSEGKNDSANALWDELKADLYDLAAVDLESIFTRLGITRNVRLCTFLRKSQSLMKDVNLEGMETEIKRRERDLKGSRSKTLHPGEFDPNAWFGGGQLDYRFSNAKVIIKDIFESEGTYVKS